METHLCNQQLKVKMDGLHIEWALHTYRHELRSDLLLRVHEREIATRIMEFIGIISSQRELLLGALGVLLNTLEISPRAPTPKQRRALIPIFPFFVGLLEGKGTIAALCCSRINSTYDLNVALEMSCEGHMMRMELCAESPEYTTIKMLYEHPWQSDELFAPNYGVTPQWQDEHHIITRARFWGIPYEAFHADDACEQWLHTCPDIRSVAMAYKRQFTVHDAQDITTDDSLFEYGQCGTFWIKGDWKQPPLKRRRLMYFGF